MEITTLGMLAALALADSTSFGTLLIPVWLLLTAGRPRPGRILGYLLTVAVCYLVIGLVLSAGARAFLPGLQRWASTGPGASVVAVLGAGLIVLAFHMDRRRKETSGEGQSEGGGRLMRWRERVLSAEDGSLHPLIVLALSATVLEVATLLPYLMAIGILTDAGLPASVHVAVMAGYCLLMILPALVLLGLRLVAHRRVEPFLARVNAWLSKNAGDWMSWIVGIIGFLMIRHGLAHADGLGAFLQSVFAPLDRIG